jgi:hypothetical protein
MFSGKNYLKIKLWGYSKSKPCIYRTENTGKYTSGWRVLRLEKLPIKHPFFWRKKGSSMQATAYCFWIRQLQLRLGSDQRFKNRRLGDVIQPTMDFRPRVEEISKRCAINNYMVHGINSHYRCHQQVQWLELQACNGLETSVAP